MSANSNASDDIQFHPPNEPSPNYQDAATEPFHPAASLEISIGYIKNRRSYLDKQTKVASTEEQIRALQVYHHLRFSPMDRFIARWIFCQKLIVQVAELGIAAPDALETQRFPREVQFENIVEHQALSTGFLRPETLQDNGRLFHESSAFDVISLNTMSKRKVLCIGYRVEKRRLVWPLVISIGTVIVSAAVTGIITRSVEPSVELGAFVGAAFGSLWSFLAWLLG